MTSTDGTSPAYASIGSGRLLLYVEGRLSHLELSWELSEERAFYKSLAKGWSARTIRAGWMRAVALPGHRRADQPYTLSCEEPDWGSLLFGLL